VIVLFDVTRSWGLGLSIKYIHIKVFILRPPPLAVLKKWQICMLARLMLVTNV
jgi:hypothetical protein